MQRDKGLHNTSPIPPIYRRSSELFLLECHIRGIPLTLWRSERRVHPLTRVPGDLAGHAHSVRRGQETGEEKRETHPDRNVYHLARTQKAAVSAFD